MVYNAAEVHGPQSKVGPTTSSIRRRPSTITVGYSARPPHGTTSHPGEQTSVAETNENLGKIREDLMVKRLSIRQERKRLRQQRAKLLNSEIEFLNTLRRHENTVEESDKTGLSQLYTDINAAFDMVGPEEEEYNEQEDDIFNLEDDMHVLEYDLKIKEKIAPGRDDNSVIALDPGHSDLEQPGPSARSSSSRGVDDEASSMDRYLSRIGDAELIKERIMDLDDEQAQILDEKHRREAVGVTLYPPNQEFLDNVNANRSALFEELRLVETEIEQLRAGAGLPPSPAVAQSPSFRLPPTPPSPPSYIVPRPPPPPPPPREPPPLSQKNSPQNPLVRSRSDSYNFGTPLWRKISARSQSEATIARRPINQRNNRDRISQWIMERLMDSSVEKAQLQAFFDDKGLDSRAWWSGVRKYLQMDRELSKLPHLATAVGASGGAGNAVNTFVTEVPDQDLDEMKQQDMISEISPLGVTEMQAPSETLLREIDQEISQIADFDLDEEDAHPSSVSDANWPVHPQTSQILLQGTDQENLQTVKSALDQKNAHSTPRSEANRSSHFQALALWFKK